MKNFKPIQITISKQWILLFRLAMVLIALPFLMKLYGAISEGVIVFKGAEAEIGTSKFLNGVVRNIAYCVIPLWFATFGARAEQSNDEDYDV